VHESDALTELLRDIQEILQDVDEPILATKDLLTKLTANEDRPWATWRHDKPMTGRSLAKLLGPLGIHPTRLERVRGYRADAFADAFARYLPFKASLRHSINKTGPELPISMCQPDANPDTLNFTKTPDFIDEMTLGHFETGNEGIRDHNDGNDDGSF
jgi:hypothetical protein